MSAAPSSPHVPGPGIRPLAPHPPPSKAHHTPPQPIRRQSHPVHTPSNLSHASSPGAIPGQSSAPTPTGGSGNITPFKRQIAPDVSGVGHERKPSVDGSRGSSVLDPSTGKKKRISLSCAQCAKRKQKCNREYPCQHCLARKVPELCVPYTPAPPTTSANGLDSHTSDRLERIENVLSAVVRHSSSHSVSQYEAVRDWLSSPAFQRFVDAEPTPPASPSSLIPDHLQQPPEPRMRIRAMDEHGMSNEDVEHIERGGSTDDEGKAGKGWLGDLEGGVPESMKHEEQINMRLDIHGTPAENLQRLITDCGVSPHKVQELVQELPPKPFADRIIDWFFTHLNFVRYPIDERLFRTSYEDLYNQTKSVDPSNVRALPLVFIVLAMAVRLAPDAWAGDDQTRKLSSLRMYWSSRRSILIATAVQSESLELVVTRLLSAMYLVLIHDRRLTECWSQLGASLRTAQAIGLHRDGSKLGLDPFQTEYRRRLWSYLYHADRLYSLILGRPPSISDSYTDTLSPSNLELSEFDLSNPSSTPVPRPLSEPTTATFLILRRSLATIIGHIVHHFQKLNEPAQYSDVQRLQGELDAFTTGLPPHFRMIEPDKSLDKQLFWLPVHRFMLLTEVLVTTIILHRPWLLRKLSSNRYAASRTACFESAKLDFQIRQEFQREVPDFRLFAITGQFKMFNSAMIAGISAIIEPRGPDSDQMRRILTTFLEQHPWSEVAHLDETTRKEVQIIHTLSRRAAQIYEDSFAPGELNAQDKDSVSLLFALRQSGDNAAQPPQRPSTAPGISYSAGSNPSGGMEDAPTPTSQQYRTPQLPSNTNNWMRAISAQPVPVSQVPAQVHQSPASTGSHEEDHSQRLLDHWLNANTSLAVGSINGQAPPLDPAGLGYLPMPAMAMTPSLSAFSFGMGGGGVLPPLPPPPGAATPTSTPFGMTWGATPTDDPSGSGLPTPTGIPHGMLGMTPGIDGHPHHGLMSGGPGGPGGSGGPGGGGQGGFGFGGSGGIEGMALGTGVVVPSGEVGQENGDEYWNALIDGILGTTGGAGHGAPMHG